MDYYKNQRLEFNGLESECNGTFNILIYIKIPLNVKVKKIPREKSHTILAITPQIDTDKASEETTGNNQGSVK
jgi:hypothetical protein